MNASHRSHDISDRTWKLLEAHLPGREGVSVSSPVNETLAMENFGLQGWPDTWRTVSPLRHHAAALRYNSATMWR